MVPGVKKISFLFITLLVLLVGSLVVLAADIIDDTEAEFDNGSYTNVDFDTGNTWVELTAPATNAYGNFESDIYDSGGTATWNTISWVPNRPSGKQLLNDGGTEGSSYDINNISMSGNVSVWHFNASSWNGTAGEVVDDNDASENAHDGVSVTSVTTDSTGMFNTRSAEFDDDGGRLEIADHNDFDASSFTLEAWVYPKSTPDWNVVAIKATNDAFDDGWGMVIQGSEVKFYVQDQANYSASIAVTTNEWNHIVGTYDGSNVRSYINGTIDSTVAYTGPYDGTSTALMIGGDNFYDSDTWDGYIDEVAFYDVVLDAGEINARYKRGIQRVRFQVRSCDDAACSGENFEGPDGTTGTYYSASSNLITATPTATLTNVDDNQYFQYKIFFETDDTGLTPEINSVTVNYDLVSSDFVSSKQKISDTAGVFTAVLDNSDYFGVTISNIGDLDGDSINDLIVGAHQDDDGGADRGAVYVLFLESDGTVSSFQKISDTAGSFTAVLDNTDYFGISAASIGDIDTDGINDIAVGAFFDDDGGTNKGAVYILFLENDGTVSSFQKISDTAGSFTASFTVTDLFGRSVASMGDVNGDSVPDIAVGAYYDDDGGTDRGAVYIIFLNNDGTVKSFQKISDTEGSFTGVLDNTDYFGVSVASIKDLNGDGINELAVGSYYDDDGGSERGAVYVMFLNNNGTVSSFQKISDTEGSFTAVLDNTNGFGVSVDGLNDFDGDGITDLMVGAHSDNDGGTDNGAIYVLYLNANGTVSSYEKISDTEGGFTGVLDNSDYFGISAANIADLDGDGVTDIAIGAYGDADGGLNRGAVHILNISQPDSYSVGSITINAQMAINRNTNNANTKVTITFTIAGAIPVNGDIDIIFPTGFILTEVGSGDVSEADSDGGTLTTSVSGQRMTINCGSSITASTELALTIDNVVNSASAGDYEGLIIETQDASDVVIDLVESDGVTVIQKPRRILTSQ
ncbi:hypothetical protein BVY03_01465 [bacterium K02(2017)]|nr:hypothetical protein BVY03_01465 [bacterium K02(2017)]